MQVKKACRFDFLCHTQLSKVNLYWRARDSVDLDRIEDLQVEYNAEGKDGVLVG